jgi:hypothetical protein
MFCGAEVIFKIPLIFIDEEYFNIFLYRFYSEKIQVEAATAAAVSGIGKMW